MDIPDFDTSAFMRAVRLYRQDKDQFLRECNYPEDVLDVMAGIISQPEAHVNEELDLKAEVADLIRDLKLTRRDIAGADSAEKSMYFRTMTQNLSTLVNMQNSLIKEGLIEKFTGVVIDYMERYLDKDQISALHGELKDMGAMP